MLVQSTQQHDRAQIRASGLMSIIHSLRDPTQPQRSYTASEIDVRLMSITHRRRDWRGRTRIQRWYGGDVPTERQRLEGTYPLKDSSEEADLAAAWAGGGKGV